jgi:hypothetical protein
MHAVIVARGLEPCLGLLHPIAGNRPSLALDLIEPLRHAIIDRLVLRAANRRELVAADFETIELKTTPIDQASPPEECFSEASSQASSEALSEGFERTREDDSISPTIERDCAARCSPSIQESPWKTHCAALRGVRFTDQGRRKFLLLYSETMEGSIRTESGVLCSVRTLLSYAVEAYEAQLRASTQLQTSAQPQQAASPASQLDTTLAHSKSEER